MNNLVVMGLVLAAGCNKSSGDNDVVAKTTALKDAMCKCAEGDTVCVGKVLDDQKQMAGTSAKLDPEIAKKLEPIMAAYTACATKAMTTKPLAPKPVDAAAPKPIETAAPKPVGGTGIRGTILDLPFEAKVAWLQPAEGEDGPLLRLLPHDATCGAGGFGDAPVNVGTVALYAPLEKRVIPFVRGEVYADLAVRTPTHTTRQTMSYTGELEWIAIPTATTKGTVRVSFTKDTGTKVEGTMDVGFCKL